jgi:hypothetical protein
MRAGQVPDPARQSRPAILVPELVRVAVRVAVLMRLAVLVRFVVLVRFAVLALGAMFGRVLSVLAGTLASYPSRIVPVLAHSPKDGP